MNVNVYVDVLFVINFIINIILLKICSVFMKNHTSALRLTLASTVGSVYAVCMFFPDISFFYILPFKFAVSLIMIKIIYSRAGFLKLIKFTAVFYLVSFTFAGILLALIYLGNISSQSPYAFENGVFYFDVSLKMILWASVICCVIIWTASAIFKRNKVLGIKTLKITMADRTCEIAALSDTGNLLTDPITGESVVIAEKKYLEKLFSEGLPDIENIKNSKIKMRLIPYSSLGNSNGVMLGFIPDEVAIDGKIITGVIIASSPNALSVKDEYNALFNPNILYNRR